MAYTGGNPSGYKQPLILQCVVAKTIPLFHYCSECVDEGQCSYHCCKLWLLHACNACGIDVKPAMTGSIVPLLLAKVATEELYTEDK